MTDAVEIPSLRAPRRRSARDGRAEARKAKLLEVTLELIGHDGVDAVSHRRVAELAGVPLGSTTYYFASREDMVVQSLQRFAHDEIASLRSSLGDVGATASNPEVLVDRLVGFLAPQLDRTAWRSMAQYALMSEAARRVELQPVVREWSAAWCALLEEVFRALGRTSPELEARMFLGMLDGLLLAGLATPDPDYVPRVLRPALERWLCSNTEDDG